LRCIQVFPFSCQRVVSWNKNLKIINIIMNETIHE
jgi:hypothetical protein